MTTKNSTLVSNFEASPKVMNAAHQLHGVKRIAQGTVALAIGRSRRKRHRHARAGPVERFDHQHQAGVGRSRQRHDP
jgi:hypothetical protein